MEQITVRTIIDAGIKKAWEFWTDPKHIINWNFASDDWHCPKATNDPRTGGRFSSVMAAKDGSMSFDFEGIYDEVIPNKSIRYSMEDGRKVSITFKDNADRTEIIETFDAESTHPLELQKAGWQAILDNFKKYVESN